MFTEFELLDHNNKIFILGVFIINSLLRDKSFSASPTNLKNSIKIFRRNKEIQSGLFNVWPEPDDELSNQNNL